jgi:alkanesulfonate monooxygenase SsuD/methylene tetrahydromethanopterin reductase-like flavin-dependent oxidoreductase (luciferase family)
MTSWQRGRVPPRFGLNVHTTISDDADQVSVAQHAEALGFDLVTVHRDVLAGPVPSFEAWTLLTWLAASTSSVALVPNVLVVPNRHPVLLAKMATTLDRLSGGRLVLALGAGAPINVGTLHSIGFPARSPRDAVADLAETIDVLRGLWRGEPYSHHGRVADLDGATLSPPPARQIPIWLGAYGPRMLRLTGQRADGWLPSAFILPPDAARPAIERIVASAREADRDPSELTLGYNVGVLLGDGVPARAGQVVGSAEQVTAGLTALVESGFDVLNLWPVQNTAEQREELAAIVAAVRERLS